MSPDLLSSPEFDTWLARRLHQLGRVELATLQELLAEARRERGRGRTLALRLVERGLLDQPELEEHLSARQVDHPLQAAPEQGGLEGRAAGDRAGAGRGSGPG